MVEFNKKLTEIHDQIALLKSNFEMCIDARQIDPIQFTVIIDFMSDANKKLNEARFALDY